MCLHPAHVYETHVRTYTRVSASICTCVRAYIDILNYVGVCDVGPGDASVTTHREIANGIL